MKGWLECQSGNKETSAFPLLSRLRVFCKVGKRYDVERSSGSSRWQSLPGLQVNDRIGWGSQLRHMAKKKPTKLVGKSERWRPCHTQIKPTRGAKGFLRSRRVGWRTPNDIRLESWEWPSFVSTMKNGKQNGYLLSTGKHPHRMKANGKEGKMLKNATSLVPTGWAGQV